MPTGLVNHQTTETYKPWSENGNSLPVLLTVTLLVFVLFGFFSVYFCRYLASPTWLRRRNSAPDIAAGAQSQSPSKGLDPSLLSSFPTFVYSSVKDLREGKYGLECAVCLSEFDENDVLRLLTVCSHVFHHDCIDLWLGSHTTCPVCRQDLNPVEKSLEVRIAVAESDNRGTDQGLGEEEEEQQHRMSFKEEEEGRGEGGAEAEDGRRRHLADLDRLHRSNSTGHTVERSRGTDDRFTLRLPEDVRKRISRERNWTGSCVTFGDFSGNADAAKNDVDTTGSRLTD
ncbi:RING-H2 finger protein ATL29-like [Magnolia sinica]|uniref:RING-H2 finger protein ATL29-like n=1 Tax=Magnolia sinica TaxID=86752 RepID=UPI00265A7884|nr:RING-H2 finger protein ATL29-like [Magnolia sinica]